MQSANDMRDLLVKEFAESYMNKLFYFCLKKTGNYVEAEDLTQDIALNIITALNKGTIPIGFSAWVWQIARNRYALWASNKHKLNISVTGSDIRDYEIADESDNILNEIVQSEQLALLRRELAFTKCDYRDVIVAYYIENKSIREIASALALSESTVKQRLYRARIFLKEGMDMAREFGKRSYKPEDIDFASSGPQPSGLPWKVIKRKIPKNILLQASNNPSTIEELSIELGIALPYIEEEVDILHRATLLEKQGEKYLTNFFILDKDCRIEIYHALRKEANERCKLIREFIDENLPIIRKLGIAKEHIEDNTIRWWLVATLIDSLIDCVTKTGFAPYKRANGETWGFVGYEITELPESMVMGHNGCGNGKDMFWTYKFKDYSMWDQCKEPTYEESTLMFDCLKNGRKVSTFSESEQETWNRINNRFAHLSECGEMVPDILVMSNDTYDEIISYFTEHKNHGALEENVKRCYKNIEEIFKKYNHKVLYDALGYYVRMELCAMRMICVHDLVDNGFLNLPEDPTKSSLGMHIILA